MSIHTCKTENLSLNIHMCDDHHQLLRERERGEGEGEREREGGREREREGGKQKDLGEDFNLTSFQDCFFFMEAGITHSFASYSHEEHSV